MEILAIWILFIAGSIFAWYSYEIAAFANRVTCRVVGHKWGWPDIPITVQPEGLRFLPQWRGCERCGHRERDDKIEAQIVIVPAFEGDIKGFNNKPYEAIGEQVKREMGWPS